MKSKLTKLKAALIPGALASILFAAAAAGAEQESGDDLDALTTKLNNPAASLISVPLQNNFEFGGGPKDDGFQYKLHRHFCFPEITIPPPRATLVHCSL